MKQKIVIIVIACSLFTVISGGSVLLHGGVKPISCFARNADSVIDQNGNGDNGSVQNDGGCESNNKDNNKDDSESKSNNESNEKLKNTGGSQNDNESSGKLKNTEDSKNESEADPDTSVRTVREYRKDGMEEIGFTLYKEEFALTENGITDGKQLVETILVNGWKIKASDILPNMNAAGTIYGTVVESGQGKREIVFKPDEEARREDTIILVVDTGSISGYKKDYYDYPICGIQICSYRDEFPEVYCNGWEPWMDSDESCAVLGTTNLITSENNADHDELLYAQHPYTYKESGTGNTVRLIFYSDVNTVGEEKILFSIETEE